MLRLADEYLSEEAIEASGVLDAEGVRMLFERHQDPLTTDAERVQMDALINHLLGVQMLHRMFVAADVPAQARDMAEGLGCPVAGDPVYGRGGRHGMLLHAVGLMVPRDNKPAIDVTAPWPKSFVAAGFDEA